MTAHLDKSLDELITEQTKSRPKSTAHVRKPDRRDRDDRRGSSHKSRGRPQQEEAPAHRAGASYWQHDDRAEDTNGWQPSRGAPAPGQRWERGQAPPGFRNRRNAAADPDPIIKTADGWEEVAQDQPRRQQRGGGTGSYYSERPGRNYRGSEGAGAGPQRRRGGVWDRLGHENEYQQQDMNGHGRQQRGFDAKQEYDPVQEDARPKRPAYYDEHDHRDDPRGARVRRFEPYSRGFGRRGRGRGRVGGGSKWKHDLFEQTAAAEEAAEVEVEGDAAEQQEEAGDQEMQE